jgi:hypothetical protein
MSAFASLGLLGPGAATGGSKAIRIAAALSGNLRQRLPPIAAATPR